MFLTIPAAARQLGVSPESLRRNLAAGKVEGVRVVRVGRLWRVSLTVHEETTDELGQPVPPSTPEPRPDRAALGRSDADAGRLAADVGVLTPAPQVRQAPLRGSARQARNAAPHPRRHGPRRSAESDRWRVPDEVGRNA